MKKLMVLGVLLLAGCTPGELKTIDAVYEKAEVVEEKISSDVTVHTVVGEGAGKVINVDEKNKWVETDLSLISQHPVSLVEASNGKLYKGELVGFDEKAGIGYLKVKSSLPLSEDINAVDPESFTLELTYKDRLTLKSKFANIEKQPSDKITDYEELLFTQNRDELEDFVTEFEVSDNQQDFIANDLLLEAIEEANASDIRYKLEKVIDITVAKTGITVVGEIVFEDAEGSETAGKITYTVTKINGAYKILNIQLTE